MKVYSLIDNGSTLARCDADAKEWSNGEQFNAAKREWFPCPVAEIVFYGRIASKKDLADYLKDEELSLADIGHEKGTRTRDALAGGGDKGEG